MTRTPTLFDNMTDDGSTTNEDREEHEQEWEKKPFGDCVELKSGSTPRRSDDENWGGSIPWISAKSLHQFYIDDAEEYVTEIGKSKSRTVPENTILILVRGMRLAKDFPVGITQQSVTFNQDIKAATPKNGVDPLYLAYALKGQESRAMNWANKTTHGTLRLTTPQLKEIPVPVPPLEEQHRIAKILGTWDQAIEQVDVLVGKKEERLHGLRQRLLTGGQRFPECIDSGEMKEVDIGEVPADWTQKRLGDLFTWKTKKNEDNAIEKVITVGKDEIRDQEEHFNRSVASDDLSNYRIIEPGDFVYDPMSAYYGALGRYDLKEPGVVSPAYRVLQLNDGYHSDFVKFLLESHYVQFRIDASSLQNNKSGKRRGLRQDAFASIQVHIPPIEEQRRIAKALGAAETEIEKLREKREALKRQKKGVMQRLLTGAVRTV